jgi:hypothetical protein
MKHAFTRVISNRKATKRIDNTTLYPLGSALLPLALLVLLIPLVAKSVESAPPVAKAPVTTNVPANTLGAFQSFLAAPPWIKQVVFELSGNSFVIVDPGTKPKIHKARMVFEASLQPDTFYSKSLSNSPFANHPEFGNGLVLGRSGTSFWKMSADQRDIYFATAAGIGGQKDQEGVQHEVNSSEETVQNVLSLGIGHLKPGSLTWNNPRSFTALSKWDMGKISGTLTEGSDRSPTKLEYTMEKWPKLHMIAYYDYAPGETFPPRKIDRATIEDGHEKILDTTRIFTLDVGERDSSLAGFTPQDFRSTDSKLAMNVFYASNGDLSIVQPNGTLRALEKPMDLSRVKPVAWPFRFLWISLTFLITLLVFKAMGHGGDRKTIVK